MCQYTDTDTQSHSRDPFYCACLCNMCSDALTALYCSLSLKYIYRLREPAFLSFLPGLVNNTETEMFIFVQCYRNTVAPLPHSIVCSLRLYVNVLTQM